MKKNSPGAIIMNQLLIFTSCTKFELKSLRNNGITITMNLPLDAFGCRNTLKVRNDVIFKQWSRGHELFC